MARQYRFNLIGLVIGIMLLAVLMASEIPRFSLVKRTIGLEDRLLPQGMLAPDFRLPTVQGKTLTLEQLRGKPAVLIFESATCTACNELKTELLKLKSAGLQSHLVFMMQGKRGSQTLSAEVQQLEDQIVKQFPVVQDTASSVFGAYKIRDVPTTYQIDEEGKIRALAVGVFSSLELVEAVEANIRSTQRLEGKG